MSSDDNNYQQKYLKYKSKYLELKQQEGGVYYKPGTYVFFFDISTYTFGTDITLKGGLSIFTDKIGNTAYYYQLPANVINNKFEIKQNRTVAQIVSDSAADTGRASLRASAKVAAAAKAATARAACSLLDPNYHKCKIDEIPETVSVDTHSILISSELKESNAIDTLNFIKRSKTVIEFIKATTKSNKSYGAVMFSVGLMSTTVIQLYIPKGAKIS